MAVRSSRFPNRATRPTIVVVCGVSLAACVGYREPVPLVKHGEDARFGLLGGSGEVPSVENLCTEWERTVGPRDERAITHTSFPETNPRDACFTPVVHDGRNVRVDAPPVDCGYPGFDTKWRLESLAGSLERDDGVAKKLVDCPSMLTPVQRSATLKHNARVLRAMAQATAFGTYPYSAVVLPGHGLRVQDQTPLVTSNYLPDEECRALSPTDFLRLGANPARASRGSDAMRGKVAPFVIVSGSAVHSHLVEAFALMHLLQCTEKIDPDHILLEPCADHTHTNLRNSARWIHAIDGRAAYLVTDDHAQARYFQDFTGWEFLFGSIDQRSLRDWGYVIGSWRQASVGARSGFWFTPYRFWAEPRDGLGSLTCVNYH
jgi:hypothetical protein